MSEKNAALLGLIDLVVDGVKDGIAVAEDGKVSASDIAILTNLIPDLGPAFANIGDVPKEIAALTPADAEELAAHIVTKLSITNVHAAGIVDAALKAAVANYALIVAIKAPAVVPVA